jgi:hypothetical protein
MAINPAIQSNEQLKWAVSPAEELKEQELAAIRTETLEKLQRAAGAKERATTFARLADRYGLDLLASLVPVLGDAGSSGLAGLYLLYETSQAYEGADAGEKMLAYIKVIGLQGVDFFVGSIPIIGDAADYFFKANEIAVKLIFKRKEQQLVDLARDNGVSEQEIAKISKKAERLPQLVEKAIGFAKLQDTR